MSRNVMIVAGRPRYHVEGCRYLSGKPAERIDLLTARAQFEPCGVRRPEGDDQPPPPATVTQRPVTLAAQAGAARKVTNKPSFCGSCGADNAETSYCTSCGTRADVAARRGSQSGVVRQDADAQSVVRGKPTGSALWSGRLARATSFRVVLGNMALAALVAAGPLYLWEPLGGVIFVLVFVLSYGAFIIGGDGVMLYCPYCRKRVKAGARACHHCGRDVLNA